MMDPSGPFDIFGLLKSSYPDGATTNTIPATVHVVLDEYLTSVCSSCLKIHADDSKLLRCSRCSFLYYCSATCQKNDWTKSHRNECSILKIIQKTLTDQPTSLARLFVRMSLKVHEVASADRYRTPMPVSKFESNESWSPGVLKLFDSIANCKAVFLSWKPFLEAVDHQFGCRASPSQSGQFMSALADMKGTAFPVYPPGNQKYNEKYNGNAPIGYGTFQFKTAIPLCKRNIAFVTVVDPMLGPVLKTKAVRPLKAGDRQFFGNALDPLATPENQNLHLIYPEDSHNQLQTTYPPHPMFNLSHRWELFCMYCKQATVKSLSDPWFGYSTMPVAGQEMLCTSCNRLFPCPQRFALFLSKLTELTTPSAREKMAPPKRPQTSLAYHMEMLQRMMPLTHLMQESVPLVAKSSVAVGLIYRKMGQLAEESDDPDGMASAYRQLLPIVEKHLDKYDQNVFDALARLIVYHLERREIAQGLVYLETAWDRLRFIPGEHSYDFYVVNKLLKAARCDKKFSFERFCQVEPK
ncbi:hypothetical protein RvY_00210 [Ramazzottius varieornatus]|uniref:MYND-type domain-containing protein n=1 Tax=Ramazzottius varieornatus TaxID=947166 RepID=A0A1D1UCX6_RAMVA|nr:hypothetical protein RvY_00210 [Ramazzottius varieornatus]